MMFFFWRAFLQEVVPHPDDRIHGLRISRMSPWELAIAKSHVRGRFIFGLVAVAIITVPIILACVSHIHQGSGSTLSLATIIIIAVASGTSRVIYVSAVWSRQSKLIDHELGRRRFDKAGKYC